MVNCRAAQNFNGAKADGQKCFISAITALGLWLYRLLNTLQQGHLPLRSLAALKGL